MSEHRKLLVPMYMEALSLWNDQSDCKDISPRLHNYTQSLLGDILQPTGLDNTLLEKGIHLHWTLPKAFRHSFLDEGTETEFPFAPDRWMILRIQTNTGITDLPSRTWIVESDFENATENLQTGDASLKPNIVVVGTHALAFKNIGRSISYDQYKNTVSKSFLTAVAPANVGFSSFYPGCRNVFGFHDNLDDLTGDCELTYVVTGWFNNPAADPLAPLNFEGIAQTDTQKRRKKELDWFREQWHYQGENYPDSCLLHTAVHSVKWNKKESVPAIPLGPVAVYAGNTSIEALSASIRREISIKKPAIEELLNALQYQLLEDDHTQPTLASIKEDIHKRGFSTRNGGTIWQINRVENQDKQTPDPNGSSDNFPANTNILADLRALNIVQQQINRLTLETLSWQQEYYLLWNKQAQKIVNTKKNTPIPGFSISEYTDARKDARDIIEQNLGEGGLIRSLQTQADSLKYKLNKYDELKGSPAAFELIEKPDDRFWEPNEPVLLLSGSGIGNTDSISGPGSKKNIDCRTIGQVMTKLELTVISGVEKIAVIVPVSSFSIPGINALSASIIPAAEEIKKITYESLLFNHSLALTISLLAYNLAQLGEGKDIDSTEIKEFASTLFTRGQKILAKEIDADTRNTAIHSPASHSVNKWKQPWSPLMMVYGTKFFPANPDLLNLDLAADTAHWKLEDNLFFKNQSSNLTETKNLIPFYNTSPFSSAVFSNLKRLLPSEITDRYGAQNLIAQSLSGLNKVLLQQNPVIQLPPLIYDIPKKLYRYHTDFVIDQAELKDIGSDGYRLGSLPGDIDGNVPAPFYPFRSGWVQIVSLSIIDAFGQEQKVITGSSTPGIVTAENLKGVNTGVENLIPMPPRFLQPTRLKFQWLNDKDQVIYQDTGKLDNPVFGWLVPNFLESSLMVYDGAGNEVIILQITSDLTKAKGINLQAAPFPGLNTAYDLGSNPELGKFIDSLGSAPVVAGLIDLALKINLNITGTSPVQHNNIALLCGQPIALANCVVQLEQLGMPAFNQSWNKTGKKDTGEIETVKVPLFIGDYAKSKDGLIGYLSDADPVPTLNTTMNAPNFSYSETEPFFKSNSPFKLSISEGPVKLTLMLDPSAGVHISSGVLPTVFFELFPQNSRSLIDSIDISFLAAPFIAEKVAPGIPVPACMNASWKFVHKTDVATWQKDQDIDQGKNKQRSTFSKQMIYEGWLKLSNLRTNT